MISNPVNKNNVKPVSKMKMIFEKNIIAGRNIIKGQKIKLEDLEYKKSKSGIKAYNYKKILGKKLKKNIKKGEILKKFFF